MAEIGWAASWPLSVWLIIFLWKGLPRPGLLLQNPQRRGLWLFFAAYALLAALSALAGNGALSLGLVAYPLAYGFLGRGPLRAALGKSLAWPTAVLMVWPLLLANEIFVVVEYGGSVFTHLLSYGGFYAGVALIAVWVGVGKRYSLRQLLLAGGLFGLSFEQAFLGPRTLWAALQGDGGQALTLLFFIPFVFIVYGLYMVAPALLIREPGQPQGEASRGQVLLLYLALLVVPLATWFVWSWGLGALGVSTEGVL